MALDIWNTVSVEVGESGFEIAGQGEDELPRDESNLVFQSIARIFEEFDRAIPPLSVRCHNDIPTTRGLGSSSAALVSGLAIGNELCGGLLDRDDLLQIAASIEGHPDNVAPAIFGGMQVAVSHNDRFVAAPVPVPEMLSAVLYVPDVPMPTQEARGLLGSNVLRSDAVFNIGRAALLVRAMVTGDLEGLDIATDDRLHQPARRAIFFPNEQHHPGRPGRRCAWGFSLRSRFHRSCTGDREGVHHRVRDGGRGGEVGPEWRGGHLASDEHGSLRGPVVTLVHLTWAD